MHMKQIESGHWLEDIVQSLLVRLEQEEFAPKAFGRDGIFHIFICEHIE